jgi:hypothetical protein
MPVDRPAIAERGHIASEKRIVPRVALRHTGRAASQPPDEPACPAPPPRLGEVLHSGVLESAVGRGLEESEELNCAEPQYVICSPVTTELSQPQIPKFVHFLERK